jgi:hypothetical protein
MPINHSARIVNEHGTYWFVSLDGQWYVEVGADPRHASRETVLRGHEQDVEGFRAMRAARRYLAHARPRSSFGALAAVAHHVLNSRPLGTLVYRTRLDATRCHVEGSSIKPWQRLAVAALTLTASCQANGAGDGPTGPNRNLAPGQSGITAQASPQAAAGGGGSSKGIPGYQIVSSTGTYDTSTNPIVLIQSFSVQCPAGTKVLGGGYTITGVDNVRDVYDFFALTNGPLSDGSGWRVTLNSGHVYTVPVTVTATCASA